MGLGLEVGMRVRDRGRVRVTQGAPAPTWRCKIIWPGESIWSDNRFDLVGVVGRVRCLVG